MRDRIKQLSVFLLISTLITAISASEPVKKEETNVREKMIVTHAMIEDDFSGLEIVPIVSAFISWMSVTHNDISILPPTEGDGLFYDVIMKGTGNGAGAFEMTLDADGKSPDPWSKTCRHTFFVIRTNSKSDIVKALDGKDRAILAFTFTGCTIKFIVVVADRMRDEEMLYATMLHELGHLWGLPDNEDGPTSIMNSHYPTSKCITKKDITRVYESHHMSKFAPQDTGCEPVVKPENE